MHPPLLATLNRRLLLAATAGLAACATAPSKPSLQRQLDTLARSEMARGRIPGMALVVLQRGEPIASGVYGWANLELQVPVEPDSVFELASVTKPFTAAAVLLLAHEGRLRLDDKLPGFIPEAPVAWADITVRQLLSHAAGLEHRFEETRDGVLLLDYSTEAMLASAKALRPFAAPGQRYRYSDQGYFLLGMIIEKASGMGYGEFLQRRFFTPLGMHHTRLQDQAQLIPKRVAGYTLGRVDPTKPEAPAWVNIRRVWQFGLTSHFGVLSTLGDMAKWEQALWRGTVLPPAVLQQLREPVYVFRRDDAKGTLLAYGHGWWVLHEGGHQMVEHSGITGTHHFRDLGTGLAVIVLTNRDQGSGPSTAQVARRVAQLIDPTVPDALN